MGTIEDAVKSGDRLKTLIAVRDNIARTLDTTCSGRDTAQLSRRLLEVVDEIESINRKEVNQSPLKKAIQRTKAAE